MAHRFELNRRWAERDAFVAWLCAHGHSVTDSTDGDNYVSGVPCPHYSSHGRAPMNRADKVLDYWFARYMDETALTVTQTEAIMLADGVHDQALVPGVPPLSPQQRALVDHQARRAARRAAAPMPAGGLFDEAARNQLDLFSGAAPCGT